MEHTGIATDAVHGGWDPELSTDRQLVPPISVSSSYGQVAPGQLASSFEYQRVSSPSRAVLERAIASLEHSEFCSTFSSGTAAVMAVVNFVHAGDHIICAENAYGGTKTYLSEIAAARHGVIFSFVDSQKLENIEAAITEKTKMIWVEAVSNPLLQVTDIRGVVAVARASVPNPLVIVDNTFLTPCFMRPLELGANVVVHSLSKYINGHTDVIMGAVATNAQDMGAFLKRQQIVVGAIPSSFDCFLVHRGIKTLPARMRAHEENGRAVASALEKHPQIKQVLSPALPSHPQHALHASQASGMCGMISFYLKRDSPEAARHFLCSLKVVTLAASLGGVESLIEVPALQSSKQVSPSERARLGISAGLVRLSVGLEDARDVIEDLARALDSLENLQP